MSLKVAYSQAPGTSHSGTSLWLVIDRAGREEGSIVLPTTVVRKSEEIIVRQRHGHNHSSSLTLRYSPAILIKVYIICLELAISLCLFCAKHRKVMRNSLSPLQWLEKNIMLT